MLKAETGRTCVGFPASLIAIVLIAACASQPGPLNRSEGLSANFLLTGQDVTGPAVPWPDGPIDLFRLKPDATREPEPGNNSRHSASDSDNLWTLLRRSMHMDLHLDNKRVRQEIAWLQRNPNYLHRLESRMQTYLPYIVQEVALRDMPAELALLPIVESALDVYAFSHGGAAGPWQFIRGTALQYRVTIDDWYDGRRDIFASTNAALQLLSDLYKRYDDWFLALAAYNAGPGNVNRALRKKPGHGYFDLPLPRETRAYVPRLLAVAAVIKDPARHGLTVPEVVNKQSFAKINLHSQFQLTTLAQVIDIELADLQHWNPAFARWATSPRGPHHAVIPLTADPGQAQAAIDAWPEQRRVDWQEITVRNGDTLSQLALRHNTDVRSLVNVNKIRRHRIRAGQKLLIPTAGEKAPLPGLAGENTIHTVRAGESLWTISRKYDVNLRKLMRTNHIGPRDPLAVGKQLIIPDHTSQRAVVRTVRYKVRRGDSLARIASKFNVTIAQIAAWNGLDLKSYIQPGQALKLHINVIGG